MTRITDHSIGFECHLGLIFYHPFYNNTCSGQTSLKFVSPRLSWPFNYSQLEYGIKEKEKGHGKLLQFNEKYSEISPLISFHGKITTHTLSFHPPQVQKFLETLGFFQMENLGKTLETRTH